jgi:hypothetical protein
MKDSASFDQPAVAVTYCTHLEPLIYFHTPLESINHFHTQSEPISRFASDTGECSRTAFDLHSYGARFEARLRTPDILTDVFRSFTQFLQVDAG